MSARYFCSASPSVSSWPAVVGSLKSGALSPTCSTQMSLLVLQHVPAGARRSRDLVAAVKRSAQREPQRDAPLARKIRVVMSQRDDIVWHLSYNDSCRGGIQLWLAMQA